MLSVHDLHVAYGPTRVLHGVTFEVAAREALAVIGRNGAGKTTLLKSIVGLIPVLSGSIALADQGEISGVPTHRRVRHGIGYVPQGRRLFAHLSVAENLAMGIQLAPSGHDRDEALTTIYDAFPRVWERRAQKAGTLSGGEQQMVALARAIAMSPRVLLLDEPSEGLAPVVVDRLIDSVLRLSDQLGFAIVIVEQNLSVAFDAASRVVVIERGRIVREGRSEDLRNDPSLVRVLAI